MISNEIFYRTKYEHLQNISGKETFFRFLVVDQKAKTYVLPIVIFNALSLYSLET